MAMTKKTKSENPTPDPNVTSGAAGNPHGPDPAAASPAEAFKPQMEIEIAGVRF